MPTTRITADIIVVGPGSAFEFAQDGEVLVVEAGVTLAADVSPTIDADAKAGVIAHIRGSVIGASTTALFNGDGAQVRIDATGEVLDVRADGGTAIAYMGSGRLENAGTIHSAMGLGAVALGGCTVLNDGLISGGLGGVQIGAQNEGGNTLINSGVIQAGGVYSPFIGYEHAVQVGGEGALVLNFGRIVASGPTGDGIWVGGSGSVDGTRVENHGDIVSARYWGVDLAQAPAGSRVTVTNFGLIEGGAGGLRGSQNADEVSNAGRIVGGVGLGDRCGRLRRAAAARSRAGCRGLGGDDRLLGGGGDDALHGGDDDDVARGFAGEDTLNGGTGADRILGGRGDDDLRAGADGRPDRRRRRGRSAPRRPRARTSSSSAGRTARTLWPTSPTATGSTCGRSGLSGFAEIRARAAATADGVLIDLTDREGGSILLESFAIGRVGADDLLL